MYDPEDKDETAEAVEEAASDEVVEEPGADSPEEPEAPGGPESEAAVADGAEPAPEADGGDPVAGQAGPELVEPELVEPEPVELTAEEKLQQQLDQSQARLRAVSKAFQDSQAEMKAFRDRMENQAKFKAERQAFDQARTFFDPVQNLKRSIDNADQGHEALVDGLKMVLHQFMEALKKLGMEEIPGVGSRFDPRIHEALAITPVEDQDQDGRVLMVHADGYTVNGKVLQAAQVVVGKYQEPAGEA